MGVKALAALVGRKGRLKLESGLNVGVVVSDARLVFGRVDVHVSPLNGNGSAWVAANRVVLEGR